MASDMTALPEGERVYYEVKGGVLYFMHRDPETNELRPFFSMDLDGALNIRAAIDEAIPLLRGSAIVH